LEKGLRRRLVYFIADQGGTQYEKNKIFFSLFFNVSYNKTSGDKPETGRLPNVIWKGSTPEACVFYCTPKEVRNMKKSQSFLRVSLALLALSGILFAGCSSGDDGETVRSSGKKASVQLRFSGRDTYTAGARVPAQSVIAGGINKAEAAAAHESFAPYTEAYTKLGAKIGSITPTSLKLPISLLRLDGENGNLSESLIKGDDHEGPPLLDLAAPVKIRLSRGLKRGHYDFILFSFNTGSMATPDGETVYAEAKFPWPEDFLAEDTEAWLNHYHSSTRFEDSSAIILPAEFEISSFYSIHGVEEVKNLMGVYFTESVHKFQSANNIATGGEERLILYVPYEGFTLPEDAAAMSIEISWNMEGLIDHYEGPDNTAYTDDDIFVWKEGWWNGFKIKLSAE
jgi:hypothetical protein